jgi:hypothetical protein
MQAEPAARSANMCQKIQTFRNFEMSRMRRRLTRAARERFDRQLAAGIDDIFRALFESGTKGKNTAALGLLVQRAVPVRRGSPVSFQTRALTSPADCAAAYGDILQAVGRGELTPAEASDISALIERRVALFATIELAPELDALKAQLAALGPRQPLRVVSPP